MPLIAIQRVAHELSLLAFSAQHKVPAALFHDPSWSLTPGNLEVLGAFQDGLDCIVGENVHRVSVQSSGSALLYPAKKSVCDKSGGAFACDPCLMDKIAMQKMRERLRNTLTES